MLKKIILALMLTVIFSCGQAFAAESTQVYDGDEKNFVAVFNEVATNEKLFTLANEPQFVENSENVDVYKAAAIPADTDLSLIFLKNKNGAIETIAINSRKIDNFNDALAISLLILGLNADEFTKLAESQNENVLTVWCEAAQRNINVEIAATTSTVDCVISATK